ncbi:MAG: nitroreductase family protein [Desulfovibrionaceae bacterium]
MSSTGVNEAIFKRHSVRTYKPEPLTGEEINELLEAARNAPSSLNTQPWRFKVVTNPDDLAWFSSSEATRGQKWLGKAPCILICCADIGGYVEDAQSAAFFLREHQILEGEYLVGIEELVRDEAAAAEVAKFGACAMNTAIAESFLMLRATEMGLGTCWVGMFNEANIKARFAIPEGYRVVNVLGVGRPDEAKVPLRKRKAMEEIVF